MENDRANVILYHPEKSKFVTFRDAGLRSVKELLLKLPKSFAAGGFHGWLHFINKKGNQVSTSVYMGQIIL